MNKITGDLVEEVSEGKFDVVIHGCNCFCAMDAGVAKQIKKAFPEAYEADLATKCGDRKKLGSISTALVEQNGHVAVIVNGYTQYYYEGNQPLVDYEAVRSVMRLVAEQFTGKRIGYPKIGAGLAGGDWNVIARIINEELKGQDHTLVEYKK